MSEERLQRMEDMIGQLIGMVGKVISEQQETRLVIGTMQADINGMKADINGMKADINGMKGRLDNIDDRLVRVEANTATTKDSISYLMDKSAEHDRDIHMLKSRVLK